MSDTTSNNNPTTPGYVTYGGVNDRPDDVNHPDNLETVGVSTDPAAGRHTANNVPDGFTYDQETDTYTRNA